MSEHFSNEDRKKSMSMRDSINKFEDYDSGPSAENLRSQAEYELITEYIDNEITDKNLRSQVEQKINSETDYYNRYQFELLTKQALSQRAKRIQTPYYVYQNITKGIDDYIKKNGNGKVTTTFIPSDNIQKEFHNHSPAFSNTHYRSNVKRYIPIYAIALIVLLGTAYTLNNFINNSPEMKENDLVAIARNIFDKLEKGEVKIQYPIKDADELKDSMEKNLDFKIFIPDVKDAELIGGVCNEVNGQKLAHIVHKKNGIMIYTLQADMNRVLNNDDGNMYISLNDNFKTEVKNGNNWFPCNRDRSRTVVIWYKGNVICSSVSEMDSQEISSILTNYRK